MLNCKIDEGNKQVMEAIWKAEKKENEMNGKEQKYKSQV